MKGLRENRLQVGLRIGFDFDGVLADDASEQVYKKANGNMEEYFAHEKEHASNPLAKGPIGDA